MVHTDRKFLPSSLSLLTLILNVSSGRSRPSVKGGGGGGLNVEFWEDNSGSAQKMRYFRKNNVGGGGGGGRPLPLILPLVSIKQYFTKSTEMIFT